MKDKIEVGEYIRTKNGIIAKVINTKYYIELYIECEGGELIKKGNIKKHSFNIIDLLEVEDIVKMKDNDIGYLEIIYINDEKMLEAVREDSEDNNIKIVSIITKEQFESMEYEV